MNDHTVDLWWASLASFEPTLDRLEAQLAVDERQRAARYRITAPRHRFVLARVLLRRVLGGLLDTRPSSLVFAAGTHGKPHLALPGFANPPRFNLSHSGDVVVLAVAPDEIGVDVEGRREIPRAERLACRFFSEDESRVVHGLDGAARDHAFLRIWTQKEAYLKATGIGVGVPLCEVETEPDPESPPRLVSVAGDSSEAARWTLFEAEIPDAVCTVAILAPNPTVRIRRALPADLAPQ
jgi:4'-phosphopantetheinyl transferase